MVTFNVHGKEYKVVFGYGLLTKTDVLLLFSLICAVRTASQTFYHPDALPGTYPSKLI